MLLIGGHLPAKSNHQEDNETNPDQKMIKSQTCMVLNMN